MASFDRIPRHSVSLDTDLKPRISQIKSSNNSEAFMFANKFVFDEEDNITGHILMANHGACVYVYVQRAAPSCSRSAQISRGSLLRRHPSTEVPELDDKPGLIRR